MNNETTPARVLCQGYQLTRIHGAGRNACIQTRLYAVMPDGAIYATRWVKMGPNFDAPNRPWKRVDMLPEGREFIGNYPLPLRLED